MADSGVTEAKALHVPAAYGEPPEGWIWSRLDDVTVGVFDCPHSTPRLTESGPFVVRTQDIITGVFRADQAGHVSEETYAERIARVTPGHGDLLYSREGTYFGIAAEVPAKTRVCLGQRMVLIRPDKRRLDFTFLCHWLNSPIMAAHIHGYRDGTVAERLNLPTIRALPILIPPLAEQKRIAEVLGALDDKIELNRRMNATLEATARALFQSWFVDFDPVRAKLDGRTPSGIDPATAALFPDSFEESPLGHIPKGWGATTLGACIGFRSGFSFKSQDWQESGIPVVKIGSVKPGIIDLTQVSFVSEKIAEQAARYRLSTGDMLIGMTGYVGEVGLVPPSNNPPLLNQRVGKFMMQKPGTESLAFWYCTTRQPEFRAFVEARSHGTAQANVSRESIMEFPLIAPSSAILDAYNRECQPMLDRILSNHAESRTLAILRDTLLPKLLSGELSVKEAA